MIEETWIPSLVDSAMTGPDSTSTKAAGMSVINGASAARNASSSSTTMKSSEKSCVWSCDEPEALMVSSWIASWPVRWTWRSPLPDAVGKVARIASIAPCASGPPLNATTLSSISAWRASPSREMPRSTSCLTLSRAPISASS